MAVRITKSAVNIREKLAELERPIGVNGAALMATNTPQDAFSLIGAGRKNLIINGKFQISQRGTYTSSTNTTLNTYYLDRWFWNGDVSGTSLQHKLDQTVNGYIVNTLYYTTNSASYSSSFGQQIEDKKWKHLLGKQITVSAWVKTNNPKVGIRLYTGVQNYGPRHSGSGNWEYLTWTFTVPTGATYLYPLIDSYNGAWNEFANSYIEITMVQLEEGKVATPFEHRSFGEELALCQRYFWKTDTNNVYSQVANGMYTTSNVVKCVVQNPVPMRSTPTVSVSSGQNNSFFAQQGDTTLTSSGATFSSRWTAGSGVLKSWLDFNNVPGGTQGYAVAIYRANGNGALDFSAEL